jgi:hypothetical protein
VTDIDDPEIFRMRALQVYVPADVADGRFEAFYQSVQTAIPECEYLSADEDVFVNGIKMAEIIFPLDLDGPEPDKQRVTQIISGCAAMAGISTVVVRSVRYSEDGVTVHWFTHPMPTGSPTAT